MDKMFKEIKISTTKRNELINITQEVEKVVNESGINTGICVVYVPHTTAGIIINENADPDVKTDLLAALDKIVPKIKFLHGEGNSDSHLKSLLCGKEKSLIVEKGSLKLGTWDGIYFAEFDGPRERKVYVKIVEG
jgi:secondary thiamine-phosphate synthase enzyme